MTTRLIVFCCGLLLMSQTTVAQIDEPAHELGLSFSSGLDFGMFYKHGTSRNLFRLQLLLLNGANSQQDDVYLDQINGGFRVGYEGRVPLVKHLNFVYGVDLGADVLGNYRRDESNNTYQETTTFRPGFWLVLGANYVFKEHWVFSVEITPHFHYNIMLSKTDTGTFTEERTNYSINYGLNTAAAKLSVAYRFGGKKKKKS